MTPEEKRIAIAQFCGWKHPEEECALPIKHEWFNPNDGCCYNSLPDYLNSLDAIQSAVLTQPRDFQLRFSTALSYRSSRTGKLFCQMTAADWADEFLGLLPK